MDLCSLVDDVLLSIVSYLDSPSRIILCHTCRKFKLLVTDVCEDELCTTSASYGYLSIIEWGVDNGYCIDRDKICSIAVYKGHLNIMEWLSSTYEFKSHDMSEAARGGHSHIVKWLRDRGCASKSSNITLEEYICGYVTLNTIKE